MKFTTGKPEHISVIQDIAQKTWGDTYGHILTENQIEYMLDMMYSACSLEEQMNVLHHHFLLAKREDSDDFEGFVSFELNYIEGKTKIHKLYVLPQTHGTGMGRALIDKVAEMAKANDNISILLNMNRFNKTMGFYKHMGFNIIREEDIDIGNGFLMEDYVFEKML